MARYAEGTSVTADASRAEIERTLRRYGATSFAYGWDQTSALVGFQYEDRQVRFVLAMPDPQAREFTHTPSRGMRRTEAQRLSAWEQGCRQRWRALALVIKAKLEAVEAGVTTMEQEFLAQTVLPNGSTVAQWALPQIDVAIEAGNMPAMLPALGPGQ